MIKIPDAKRKLDEFTITPALKQALTSTLDRQTTLALGRDAVLFIQGRLAQPHLGYLEPKHVTGLWGKETDAAFQAVTLAHGVGWAPGGVIGQTCLLALLDGSIPFKKPAGGVLLPVTYYSQRDSQTGHSGRMCFSSTCAMMLNYKKPGVLIGVNGDDQYLRRLFSQGGEADTTLAYCQVKALASYGLTAEFRQDLDDADILASLERGNPIGVGWLHHGPVGSPKGGGHWSLIIGITADMKSYIVLDPWGEINLLTGVYVNTNGNRVKYSKKNFTPRWRVNGSGGWGMVIK